MNKNYPGAREMFRRWWGTQAPSQHLYTKLGVPCEKPQHCEGWIHCEESLGLAVCQPRGRFHKRALSKRIKEESDEIICPTSSDNPEHIHIVAHTCVHIPHIHRKTMNKRSKWKLEEHYGASSLPARSYFILSSGWLSFGCMSIH